MSESIVIALIGAVPTTIGAIAALIVVLKKSEGKAEKPSAEAKNSGGEEAEVLTSYTILSPQAMADQQYTDAYQSFLCGDRERRKGNIQCALGHYREAEQIYRNLKATAKLAYILSCMSILENIVEKGSEKAREYASEAIALYATEKDNIAPKILINMGAIQSRLGHFEAAKHYYQLAEDIYEKDDENLANVYRLRGILEGKLGHSNIQIARQYLASAREKYIGLKDTIRETKVIQSMGDLEREHKGYRLALTYYKKAWDMHKSINDPRGKSFIMGELCRAHALVGNKRKAKRWKKRILSAYEQMPEQARDYVMRCLNKAEELLAI